MKILAIRGQNLASLARAFEVDLEHGALARAGLFAITGPVGAGKSTLLDALCLPLFDRTPRLSGRGGPTIGDDGQDPGDWLRGNDPRSLLRRDAIEGHAEVDFVGRDQRRYRARWSVRRARRRADGRLQEQELSLFDLQLQQFVARGRRSEVLAAIEQRLGLDFGQFCRSVLLAQGDFAAFLHASADERARLLENLTGADIYRRLSRAAHEGRKRREAELQVLQQQVAGQPLLAAEQRHALAAKVQAATAELLLCRQAVEIARSYVTWYQAATAHRDRESHAQRDLQTAVCAFDGAAARRELQARRQRAWPLVSRLELVVDRQKELTRGIAEREDAARECSKNVAADQQLTQRLDTAVRDWWPTGGEVPTIVREFERWSTTLQRWVEAQHEQQRCTAAIVAAQKDVAAASKAEAQAERSTKLAEVSLREIEHIVAQATAAAAASPFEQLPALRRQLAAQRSQAETRRELMQQWRAAVAAWQQSMAQLEPREQRAAQLALSLPPLVERCESLQQQCHEAQSVHDQLRVRAGLSQFRGELHDGRACPLCGSAEHPAPIAQTIDTEVSLQALRTAERQREQARQLLAQASSEQREAERSLAAAEVAAQEALLAKEKAHAAWRRTVLDEAPADIDGAAAWLDELRGRALQQEAEFEQLSAAAESAHRHLAAASAEERTRRAALTHESEQQRSAAQRRAAAQLSLDTFRRELERCTDTQAELLRLLDPVFDGADWQARVSSTTIDGVATLRAMSQLAQQQAVSAAAVQQSRATLALATATVARQELELKQADAAFRTALASSRVQPLDVREVASLGAEALAQEAEELHQMEVAVERARAIVHECESMRRSHESTSRPAIVEDDAKQAYDDARGAHDRVDKELGGLRASLAADDLLRRHHDELLPRITKAEQEIQVWRALDDLIGSSTGDAFVIFTQGLTLDLLLIEANRRLAEIARRYRLQRIPGGEMDFVVADLELGGTRRSLQSLSGGETFLVSLALALALATLAAPRARVETLFLDEGFGTLDAQNLEAALGALDTLQANGCQVGVISHVDGFAERIGCVVEVRPEGNGQSRVLASSR